MTPKDTVNAQESILLTQLQQWRQPDTLLLAAIQEAVGPNTWRAFRKCPKKPSLVFCEWAEHSLIEKEGFAKLSKIKSKEKYDKWLKMLVSDLQNSWEKNMSRELNIGPAYKLVNLLLKRVSRELPRKRKKVLQWLHVPLDKHTLAAIREVITFPRGRKIRSNATMAFIANIEDYNYIQQGISDLAKKAQVPPIALDYIAYNNKKVL